MGVGQIDVLERQRSRGRILGSGDGVRIQERQIPAGYVFAARKCDRRRRTGDHRGVVAAGDRDRDRYDRRFVKRRVVVVDPHVVGQRQCFAGGQEIERVVRQAVGPGRIAVVVVAGTRDHDEFDFGRRDVLLLQGVQREVLVLGVLVDERREVHLHRRPVAGIDVDKVNVADDGILVGGVAGLAGKLGQAERRRRMAGGVEHGG